MMTFRARTRVLPWWVHLCLCASTAGPLLADASRPHQLQLFPPNEPIYPAGLSRDAKGYVWVAAAQGVFRFDGRHYHRWPGYPLGEARFLNADQGGTLWVGGANGLATWREGAWTVLSQKPVQAWASSPDGIWWAGDHLEFRDWQGQAKPYPNLHPTGQLKWAQGKLWFPRGEEYCAVRENDVQCRPNSVPGPWQLVAPEEGGRMWFSSEMRLSNGQESWAVPRLQLRGILDPMVSPEGRVWFTRPGLPPGLPNWTTSPMGEVCTEFLSETSRLVCVDERAVGRFDWNREWETWNDRQLVGLIGMVEANGQEPLTFTKRGLYGLEAKTREWRLRYPGVASEIRAVERRPSGELLLATQEAGIVEVAANGRVVAKHHPCLALDTYRAFRRDAAGRMFVGGKDADCLLEMVGRGKSAKFVRQALPGGALHTVALELAPSGEVWAGYEWGLAARQADGTWRKIVTSEPVVQVRNFTFASADSIWISHRRPGHFTRIDRNGESWRVTRFRDAVADTHFLRVDSRGWIWRGTDNGVFIARPGRTAPGEWIRLDEASGAALGSLTLSGFTEDRDGQVWVAGEGGVLRVRPSEAWFDRPKTGAPWISRVAAGGREWLEVDKLGALPVGEAITIEVASPEASAFRVAPVEYRIDGQDWREAREARLTIPEAEARELTLELRYSGSGPGESSQARLRVGEPGRRWLQPMAGWATVGALVGLFWWRRQWLQYWVQRIRFFLAGDGEEGEESRAQAVGSLLHGRYRVEAVLSRGGFSVTYRAADTREGEAERAVKVLRRASGRGAQTRQHFAHEVAAMRSLDHPGIAPLLDWFITAEGEPCLVMPYIAGPTLRQALQAEGPWPTGRVAELAEQLGAALAAVHGQGLVHRDLKPENIILAADQAKIIDFGVSAVRGPEGELEETTQIAGSIQYLAPERLLLKYSAASDVYSLGVILLETLTGKRLAEFASLPVEADFAEQTATWMSREATTILVEALRHQPSRRPQDAAEWTRRLSERLRADWLAMTDRSGNPPLPAIGDGPASVRSAKG